MNVSNLLLWGFAATLVLTTVMAIAKPLGLTRMDLPFLLGTMVTSSRNKAPWARTLPFDTPRGLRS